MASTSPTRDHDDPATDATMLAERARSSRRLRNIVVSALAVLTCVATLASVVAVWTHETLFDTDSWMEIVGPLADDPAVIDAVGAALSDQLFQVLDTQQLATKALPEQAAFLAAPLTNAVEGYVATGVEQVLQTEQFRQIWDRANRLAHDAAVKILRGEPVRGLTTANGTVTLNLLPLLARAMTFLDEKAPRLFGDGPIPSITADMPIDQARQELSTALGRPLPEGFGVFILFQNDQLAAAQRGATLFDQLVYVLIGLTLILLVATIVLSLNRRRTIILLGFGIALAMVTANAIVSAFQDQVLGLIGNEVSRKAATATVTKLVNSLEVSTTALTWAGLVVVAVAFLAGDSRTARGVRRAVVGGARRARATGSSVVTTDGRSISVTALPVVARNLNVFRAGGVIVTMLWLIVTDITWVKLALILLVFAAYEAAVTVLGHSPDDTSTTSDAAVSP